MERRDRTSTLTGGISAASSSIASFSFGTATGTNLSFTNATATNLYVSGLIQFGTIYPLGLVNNTYDLGSASASWRNVYASGTGSTFFGITWTYATGTNTTSTNLYATNLGAANGLFTNASATYSHAHDELEHADHVRGHVDRLLVHALPAGRSDYLDLGPGAPHRREGQPLLEEASEDLFGKDHVTFSQRRRRTSRPYEFDGHVPAVVGSRESTTTTFTAAAQTIPALRVKSPRPGSRT